MRTTEIPVRASIALARLAGIPRDLQLQTVANDSFSESDNAFMLPVTATISENTSLMAPESTQVDAETQQDVLSAAQTGGMTPWERIDGWLTKKRHPWSWLGTQLGYSDQQIGNWKSRGVPPKEYENIAIALGESMDWIVGRGPARGEDLGALTAMAIKVAQEFDTIPDPKNQLDAFAKIVTIITKHRGL